MIRILVAAFSFACALPMAVAQDIPGVRTTLTAEPAMVRGSEVVLRLSIEVTQDAEVPADLLTGVKLDVKVGDAAGPMVREAGKGGAVALSAGTSLSRLIKLPVDRLAPNAKDGMGVVTIAISWPDMTGANCVVQIAPDLSKISIDQLDLKKTKVVLVTNYGEMTIAFYADKAPETVKNFLKLAKDGFYDGTKFHRVIRNFMVQGGDPLTKNDDQQARWGTGDPGYKVKAEFNDTKHTRGTLSMARSADPDSAGSQFFVCHADAAHLDNQYTAFGALESGLDVLDKIANVQCGGNERSTPLQPVKLEQAIVMPVMKQ
jgi:peptidyl-prolyl cis-trans isomerase B (cyclophilin B)